MTTFTFIYFRSNHTSAQQGVPLCHLKLTDDASIDGMKHEASENILIKEYDLIHTEKVILHLSRLHPSILGGDERRDVVVSNQHQGRRYIESQAYTYIYNYVNTQRGCH